MLLNRKAQVDVPGLKYVADFITELDELDLLAAVDAEPWLTDLKRRVQHYGYRYDYKARKVDPSMHLGSLPGWAQSLAARLVADGYMSTPDQLIVNEYEPGQGIAPHVDCVTCFGSVVCSITLGSQCMMELSAVNGEGTRSLLLERCSLVVLAGESRYEWRHAIARRKTDKIGDQMLPRNRRVSLTFRTVIIEGQDRR
ncbi:MAG: alpha-ketoglutarate-dependent dioxygenase AlkB [Cyanobacteria bacterium]|nr:alpha-ketoglutarate-dependent dioxygenase AlkB [Cyanobacteriota bacterium]MDW8203039.1 alpha-ketoglutarate-dependent dioxygenase AlkB [Cyanobacteriota bacterium SKYGB_h_bin112]